MTVKTIFSPLFAVIRHLRNRLLLGILLLVPLFATVLILVWAFNSIDSILQPIVITTWGKTFPGIGVGIVVILAYIMGVIASTILGRKILSFGDRLLERIPVFKYIYRGIRQIVSAFSEPRQTGFMQVVFVEYPRKGMYALAFVTNMLRSDNGELLYTIFIPTSPNPTSGFMQVVKEDEIILTKISVEDALRVIVSAGRVPLEVDTLGKKNEDTSKDGG